MLAPPRTHPTSVPRVPRPPRGRVGSQIMAWLCPPAPPAPLHRQAASLLPQFTLPRCAQDPRGRGRGRQPVPPPWRRPEAPGCPEIDVFPGHVRSGARTNRGHGAPGCREPPGTGTAPERGGTGRGGKQSPGLGCPEGQRGLFCTGRGCSASCRRLRFLCRPAPRSLPFGCPQPGVSPAQGERGCGDRRVTRCGCCWHATRCMEEGEITAPGTCYHVLRTLTFTVSPAPALLETSFPQTPGVPRDTRLGPRSHCVPPGPAASQEGGMGSKPRFIPQAPVTAAHRQFQLMSISNCVVGDLVTPRLWSPRVLLGVWVCTVALAELPPRQGGTRGTPVNLCCCQGEQRGPDGTGGPRLAGGLWGDETLGREEGRGGSWGGGKGPADPPSHRRAQTSVRQGWPSPAVPPWPPSPATAQPAASGHLRVTDGDGEEEAGWA